MNAAAADTSSHPALYRALIKDAAAQGRELMLRVVARALAEMPRAAAAAGDVVERGLLEDATARLQQHSVTLGEAYPQALLAAVADAVAPEDESRRAGPVSFRALQLMGDEQVRESVEQMRVLHEVAAAVEAELSEFTPLVCAAQGLPTVQADRNPLKPDVYVRALRSMVDQSPVSASVRRRWLLHLGRAMGPELAQSYRQLTQGLSDAGVHAAGFTIVPGPGGVPAPPAWHRRQPQGPAGGAPQAAEGARHLVPPRPGAHQRPGAGESAADAAGMLLDIYELKSLLAGASPAAAEAPPPPDFSATVPAAFEVLQEMRQVEEVMRRLRERNAGEAPVPVAGMEAVREAVRREARSTGQQLGLEVVALMVENIAGDPRLLPAVQQAVRDLEPALLRLALDDPRFFSDPGHPARRLLDEVTLHSLAWTDEDASGYGTFIDGLQQAVGALLSTRASGPEPFDFALRTLQESWADARRRDRRSREKAVRSLLSAEKRNLLAAQVARELRGRDDIRDAPAEIARFVTGPWAQVIAQARLAEPDGAPDPHGYRGLVSDLLWSTRIDKVAANPARLAKLLPQLLAGLREGLASIGVAQGHVKRLLDVLADIHRRALRPGAVQEPAGVEATHAEAADAAEEPVAAEPWLVPSEAKHSNFLDSAQVLGPSPLFAATQVAQSRQGAGEAMDLAQGSWIELLQDGAWSRMQLAFASPHGMLLLFTDAQGRTQSMTRLLLGRLAAAGQLRLVSAPQEVVDGALDAVAQQALRNSAERGGP